MAVVVGGGDAKGGLRHRLREVFLRRPYPPDLRVQIPLRGAHTHRFVFIQRCREVQRCRANPKPTKHTRTG
eukprot:4051167-Pyramimonas_sp.AAC.1